MSENTLPFSPDDRDLVVCEVVGETVDKADLCYEAIFEILDENETGLDRGVLTLHLWHLLSRDLMIEHHLSLEDMISAVRKVAREARPAIKVRNFIAKIDAEG